MARKLGIFGLSVLGALACQVWTTSAEAAVPGTLTQQGRLLDAAGMPVAGAVAFVFTLYDVATAGVPLWSESQTITLDDGYFSARLGDMTPIPGAVFDGKIRFLGIKVATDAEMAPRQPLLSVPYAFISNDSVGALHPLSVTVNGIPSIKADGSWGGPTAGLQGIQGIPGVVGPKGDPGTPATFGTALVTAAAGTTDAASSTSTCPAGKFVTGGGCAMIASCPGSPPTCAANREPSSFVKGDEPSGNNAWVCACASAYGTCTVTATARCGGP